MKPPPQREILVDVIWLGLLLENRLFVFRGVGPGGSARGSAKTTDLVITGWSFGPGNRVWSFPPGLESFN